MSVLDGALWDIGQVHFAIWEIGKFEQNIWFNQFDGKTMRLWLCKKTNLPHPAVPIW